MSSRATTVLVATLLATGPSLLNAVAQEIQLGDSGLAGSGARRQHVELQTDLVHVKPGRPDWIELRFRVDPGLHINSHSPHDELLVPTTLEVASPELKIVGQEYPAGIPLRLEVGAGETLSTYQGEFRVRLQVVVTADTQLSGTLHYQACDARACFPPKNLPVQIAVSVR